MKKILAGFIMDGKSGGIDKYLLNFLEVTKGQNIRIDFLTNKVNEELKNQLMKYHSRLFAIASLRHPVQQYQQVSTILQKGQYDMVYFNVSTAIDGIAALAAKRKGVPERIIHSHSSGNDSENNLQRIAYNTIHTICRQFLYKTATGYCGCSKKAGLWLFPEKVVNSEQFQVVFNAVDRTQFLYDEALRKRVRETLHIEQKFVIGHVGNFCYAKNYPFLIKVFAEIVKRQKNAVLVMAGTGIELDEVKKLVRQAGIEKSVRFLGWSANTNELYQAFDVLLLPSRFEGLPIVGVEAQCTKLQCVFSDSITKEAKIQERCYFLPLKLSPAAWAKFIIEHQSYARNEVRLLPQASNYDLEKQSNQFRRLVWE